MSGGVVGSFLAIPLSQWLKFGTLMQLLHIPLIMGYLLTSPMFYQDESSTPIPYTWALIGMSCGMITVVLPTHMCQVATASEWVYVDTLPTAAVNFGVWAVDFLIGLFGFRATLMIALIASCLAMCAAVLIQLVDDTGQSVYGGGTASSTTMEECFYPTTTVSNNRETYFSV